MNEPGASDYDEVLYGGHARPQTHPDRLGTLATLFDMKTAPLERCRVLELGCGDGANLIPMAFGLPGATFVGIDLAERAVGLGRDVIHALGLTNIALEARDLLEVSPEFGQFDYIIAHGLLSWVPPVVREKTFLICKKNLAPNGVAYLSYNAFPGSRQRQMVRDLLLRHMPPCAGPHERIRKARELIRFLRSAISGEEDHARFMGEELDRIQTRGDAALFHDDLAAHNVPFYFHQFMERAKGHGLQFLAEADFADMQEDIAPPEILAKLRAWAGDDVVRREQYLDFVKNRGFRQTLLCHANIPLDRRLAPERIRALWVASSARAVGDQPDIRGPAEVEFRGPKGAALVCDSPLVKAALVDLGNLWPASLPFPELIRTARAVLDMPETREPWGLDEETLAAALLQSYGAGLVELHMAEPAFGNRAGERPMASALARLQVKRGADLVSSLAHKNVRLEDRLSQHLLMLLDGTRDRVALLTELTALAVSEEVSDDVNGKAVQDRAPVADALAAGLEPILDRLARMALLVR